MQPVLSNLHREQAISNYNWQICYEFIAVLITKEAPFLHSFEKN